MIEKCHQTFITFLLFLVQVARIPTILLLGLLVPMMQQLVQGWAARNFVSKWSCTWPLFTCSRVLHCSLAEKPTGSILSPNSWTVLFTNDSLLGTAQLTVQMQMLLHCNQTGQENPASWLEPEHEERLASHFLHIGRCNNRDNMFKLDDNKLYSKEPERESLDSGRCSSFETGPCRLASAKNLLNKI